MWAKALSITKTNFRKGCKIKEKPLETCPKCGYDGEAQTPTVLPGGINPAILLDSSPSPQLLLSENNIIVYANKCAARILRVKQVEAANQGPSNGAEPSVRGISENDNSSPFNSIHSGDDGSDDYPDKPFKSGLEGRTIDQLNINIADEDMRRWVSLIQVFENIKLNLAKREAKKLGRDDDEADLYGEGPKYNSYDYYGDHGKSKHSHAHADRTIRDTAPVVIEKENGKVVLATMYVTLIDPYNTGYSYSSICLVPGATHEDATFTTQMAVEDHKERKRKRDKLKRKLTNLRDDGSHKKKNETQLSEQTTGKSGENMLKRVARIKNLILDEMEYCFIALSPDGDIVITNAATKAILGQETLQASIGEGFEWISRLDIWRPDFSERLPFEEWALNRLITHHQPLTQVIGLYAGPHPVVAELRGKCIWEDPEKEENLLAALAIVVDQTQWFSKEKRLNNIQSRQGAFISNISRELKTPVSGMIGLLELLYETRKALNPEQLSYIRQIFGSVNSLLLVINDIIDFNRISTGDVAIARNAFVLQDLVEELETLFSESMAKDGVKFEVITTGINQSAFGDGSRLMLLGDDVKIRRIGINMLSNAFRYTAKGKVALHVLTQQVLRNSLVVRFEIMDTGVGISEEDRQRLFLPLDEITAQEAEEIGVDGIGLNIARKFVSLLGGDIGCESIRNKGTSFWFTVPCGRPSPDSKVTFGPKEKTLSKTMGIVIHSKELEESTDLDQECEENQAKIHIEGTVVLLVEDNWAHQIVMEKRLRRIGCEVLTAVNGRDAISILKRGAVMFDIVFMDIQMPLLNGFEATKLIREDPEMVRWRNIPIIGFASAEEQGDRDKADKCGLDEFTVEPLMDDVLKRFVEKFMDPVAIGKRRGSEKTDSSIMSPTLSV